MERFFESYKREVLYSEWKKTAQEVFFRMGFKQHSPTIYIYENNDVFVEVCFHNADTLNVEYQQTRFAPSEASVASQIIDRFAAVKDLTVSVNGAFFLIHGKEWKE